MSRRRPVITHHQSGTTLDSDRDRRPRSSTHHRDDELYRGTPSYDQIPRGHEERVMSLSTWTSHAQSSKPPPPSIPDSQHGPHFEYDTLDLSTNRPSIRLATLRAGTHGSQIHVDLVQVAFADKPKYEALSYTWGKEIADDVVDIHGFPFQVTKNLWKALEVLRFTDKDRTLWIDAICINQLNLEERNRQVSLMAYIYTRAEQVLVWLGTIAKFDTGADDFTLSDLEKKELCKVAQQDYWWRVWIVQEIGAASKLEVHWRSSAENEGKQKHESISYSMSWEQLFLKFRSNYSEEMKQAIKLGDQREGRHGDSFLLANLMDACQDSLCQEIHDKIYGFVGIAHDCQNGEFPVDYSKSLLELYNDFVEFRRPAHDNAVTIVHFSQLAIKLLNNFGDESAFIYNNEPMAIRGNLGGCILSPGPSYAEMIALPEAMKRWNLVLSKCKTDMSRLRLANEGFMRLLPELTDTDLEQIRPIKTTVTWRRDTWKNQLKFAPFFKFDTENKWEWPPLPGHKQRQQIGSPQSPHLFMTEDGVIGLAPFNARIGDRLYQFWNSDVVAVVRQWDDYLQIVGRAVIANPKYTPGTKFCTPLDLKTEEATNSQGQGTEGMSVATGLTGMKPTGFDFNNRSEDIFIDVGALRELTK